MYLLVRRDEPGRNSATGGVAPKSAARPGPGENGLASQPAAGPSGATGASFSTADGPHEVGVVVGVAVGVAVVRVVRVRGVRRRRPVVVRLHAGKHVYHPSSFPSHLPQHAPGTTGLRWPQGGDFSRKNRRIASRNCSCPSVNAWVRQ